LQSRYSLLVT